MKNCFFIVKVELMHKYACVLISTYNMNIKEQDVCKYITDFMIHTGKSNALANNMVEKKHVRRSCNKVGIYKSYQVNQGPSPCAGLQTYKEKWISGVQPQILLYYTASIIWV